MRALTLPSISCPSNSLTSEAEVSNDSANETPRGETFAPPLGVFEPPLGVFEPPLGVFEPPLGVFDPPLGVFDSPRGVLPLGVFTDVLVGVVSGVAAGVVDVEAARETPVVEFAPSKTFPASSLCCFVL